MSAGDPQRSSTESARRHNWLGVWGLTVAWMLIILAATSVPGRTGASSNGLDKLEHFVGYAISGALIRRSWHLRAGVSGRKLWRFAPLIIGGAWALLDELHQIPIPGREFELSDVVADLIGIVTGFLLAAHWHCGQGSQFTD